MAGPLTLLTILAALGSLASNVSKSAKAEESQEKQQEYTEDVKEAREKEAEKQARFKRRQALKSAIGAEGVEYYRPGPKEPDIPKPISTKTEDILGGIFSGLGQLSSLDYEGMFPKGS